MTIVLFIIVLVILIITHELGHFLAAKISGVRVDEFGLGFPPKIISKKWGETLYSLNWVPFGGFVKIAGEDNEESEDKRFFTNKPAYTKIFILASGVLGNLLTAWLFLAISLQSGLLVPVQNFGDVKYVRNERVIISGVSLGSPAGKAGMTPGNVLKSLTSGNKVLILTKAEQVSEFIASSNGPIGVNYIPENSTISKTINITPEKINGVFKIGVAIDTVGEARYPIIPAFIEAGHMVYFLTQETVSGLWYFVSGLFAEKSTISQVSGPLGIFGMVSSASALGGAYLLGFIALLSINLAVLNVLPIPALDGGRILFVLIETIKGSPLPAKAANNVNMIGFALLILLMLIVTASDIIKIFH